MRLSVDLSKTKLAGIFALAVLGGVGAVAGVHHVASRISEQDKFINVQREVLHDQRLQIEGQQSEIQDQRDTINVQNGALAAFMRMFSAGAREEPSLGYTPPPKAAPQAAPGGKRMSSETNL